MNLPDDFKTFYESFPTHQACRQIEADQVVALVQSGKRVVFVDARSRDEQAVSVVPGAVCVSLEKDAFEVTQEDCARALAHEAIREDLEVLGAEHVVVCYCTAGLRGALCAMALENVSSAQVFNLAGGIIAWRNQGLPLERAGRPVRDVHPCVPSLAKYLSA
ncbi:MAG: rhodanese-like domain-containing protein [Deltaproteobacteria bacterium]|nr:rhodanese-like domain-containing protein [Deltaproteobacteria bacterium]